VTTQKKKPMGLVAFVGIGPGDPGLLTVRATQVLGDADVLAVGNDVAVGTRADLVARYCRPDVELVEMASGVPDQPLTPAGRARLVTRAARGGGHVVRLLVGDGTTFAGLAEELVACNRAGIPTEVVPGVALHTAVPVYAGIPTTSGAVSAVHVVDAAGRLDTASLLDERSTVVLLGSRGELAAAVVSLVDAGRSASAAVAVTAQGSTTAQSTVVSTLEDLPKVLDDGTDDDFPRPLVAITGPSVDLRDRASWFQTRPLFGWRVLVPRTQAQSTPTTIALAAHGAVSDVVPTISVEPPRTPHQMEKAVKGLVTGRYEWVGFTSVNAVRAVREKFGEFGLDARAFAGLKIAAVGGVTAAALRNWGIEPDLLPSGEQSASGLLEEWPPFDEQLDPINRVFLPRADIATDTLVAGLLDLGWEVDDVTAYRTVRAAPPASGVRDAIKNGSFDAVVFTSSSTVRNLVGIAGKPHPSTVVACIGPATAKTAQEHGLRVDVLATEPSVEHLVRALAEFGTGLRDAAVEAGEPVLRPSQKRPGARRKVR